MDQMDLLVNLLKRKQIKSCIIKFTNKSDYNLNINHETSSNLHFLDYNDPNKLFII